MTKSPFIPYTLHNITEEDIEAVITALKSSVITRGAHVEAFEEALAKKCDAKYAVVFNSGSSALKAAYQAMELNSLDRFYTTPNTFAATLTAALAFNITPTLVDIDRKNGLMDLDLLIENLHEKHSRGRNIIVPVHFAGIAQDMKKLDHALKDTETFVIEDAAHALGSYYPSLEKVGSCCYSAMTVLSFHPAKQITCGEGGAVTTNSLEYYNKLKQIRNNGIYQNEKRENPWEYDVEFASNNLHLTEFQAALGLSQLKRLDEMCEKRKKLVSLYRRELEGIKEIQFFSQEHDKNTCYHLMLIQVDFKKIKKVRSKVMRALHSRGVGTQVLYIPLYKHTFFQKLYGDVSPYFEEMEGYYHDALALPLYASLREEDVRRVVRIIKKVL
jgi:dTDP-4-amino-4,6-dideoxygalactose transaminase